MARKPKPKKVSYRLIDAAGDEGQPMYQLLNELVAAHHEDLVEARIALAWCTSWKADVDGIVTLGKCRKASDLDRELSEWDFIILLSREFWRDQMVTDVQRRALLDHELCHAAMSLDEQGEPKVDERGRVVYRVRKHDLEEFTAIAERYGCWKRDLETFNRAINRARQKAEDQWVGYTTLQEDLRNAGLTISLDVIVEWTDAERREARTWALLRQEQFPQMWRDQMPAFIAHVATLPQETDDAAKH